MQQLSQKKLEEYKRSKDYASNLQIWHAHQNPVLESILVSTGQKLREHSSSMP